MNNKNTAIITRNLAKTYRLYKKPSDRVKEVFHPHRKKYSTRFHALRNVSLHIKRGETIGIIGRNGSGKSTLLQLICGIMPPSSGFLEVNGRVSAILELGAGFNLQFSGLENIYLNCSIFGIKHSAVEALIPKIIDFAEIGDFIDHPVRTYSSGMQLRLAFSIAINVDPAILIIDEALAVGDAAFQRKCFSRIKAIQGSGATILFVSHNASAVVELCDRAVLLENGAVLLTGKPNTVTSWYHKLILAPPEKAAQVSAQILNQTLAPEEEITHQPGQTELVSPAPPQNSRSYFLSELISKSALWYEPNGAVISSPRILDLDGNQVNMLAGQETYLYTYQVRFQEHAHNVRFCMCIKTTSGFELGGFGNHQRNDNLVDFIEQGSVVNVLLRFRCMLLHGTYFLNAGVLGVKKEQDYYLHRGIDVAMFEVLEAVDDSATVIVDFDIQQGYTFVR